ncbi:hypothetical protein GE21DRAFT_4184 [Neurospora crassa]|uniref:Uncharacterized protein n=1 Tax=Neurospora crassa (strain ATCC 24698 / 74-OR23-1A / CBS 708.71 / DSM 1257 / FGSC 987) TaxID=367110 RepID=U9W846_NEUCR|nr:hypothetical protein NCU06206 [Neurospora crassa OR74A]ESA43200.1 hypothetical protein NCU06206 [Neurospora crassa OR74A]KHE87038.1 hypothetical protein GE21DRAFT_4184 [Neurospora crassa]|eukprot:XP_011393885.1 hypothetical protein NCU06206 [Neurospora crassa OR74A]
MSSNINKNLYYTVPLDDDLESQDYLQEKKAPWFSVPVRSAAVAAPSHSSPLSALWRLPQRWWLNDDSRHHNSGNTRVDGSREHGRGFWDRWIWLVHAVLLTISVTLFALSMCTLQTTTGAGAGAAAAQCQCQGTGMAEGAKGAAGASSFGKGFTDVDISWVLLDSLLILFCLWILVPRSFYEGEEKTTTTTPAAVLPVPVVDIPESQHVDMKLSMDDKTWVEEDEE